MSTITPLISEPISDHRGYEYFVARARAIGEPIYVLMHFSPAFCAFLLANHNKVNRKIRAPHVEDLVRLILGGEWKPEAGIVKFDTTGNLMNGQHRLTAFVQLQRTMVARCAFGVTEDVRPHIDILVLKRNVVDIGDWPPGMNINSFDVGMAKRAYTRGRRRRAAGRDLLSHETASITRLYAPNIELLKRSVPATAQRYLTTSGMAAMLRATFSVDESALRAFGQIVATGMPPDGKDLSEMSGSVSVIKLRDYLMNNRGRKTERDVETYRKTERAFLALLEGEALGHVYQIDREQFGVPDGYEDPIFKDAPAKLKAIIQPKTG